MCHGRAISVLYMEDDPSQARLTKRILEQAGYEVDVACNGADGLAKYADGSYDVVLLDQAMPVQDGLDVVRHLASQGPLPPTIMLTATGTEAAAAEVRKLGASDYLSKHALGRHMHVLLGAIARAIAGANSFNAPRLLGSPQPHSGTAETDSSQQRP